MIVVTDNHPFEKHLENINKNVDLCIVKNVKLSYLHPLNLFKALKTIKIIKEFDPEIIHAQQGDMLTILISIFLNKCALITTIHDARLHLGWEKKYLFRFTSEILRAFDWGEIPSMVVGVESNSPVIHPSTCLASSRASKSDI